MRLAALVVLLGLSVSAVPAQRVGTAPPACSSGPGALEDLAVLAVGTRQLAVSGFETSSGEQAVHDLAAALGNRVARRLQLVRPREVLARSGRGRGTVGALNGRSGAEARYVLTGALQPGTANVVIAITLLDGRTGRVVWQDQIGRPRERLAELEGAIASAVATRALRDLTSEEMRALGELPTANAGAYDHFLRGMQWLNRVGRAPLKSAIEELDAAWRRDPGFADAWMMLALAYSRFLGREPIAAQDKEAILAAALEATERTLALDSRRSEAWVARALLLEARSPRDVSGVREAYERALVVNPDDPEAHRRLGRLLVTLGEFERAATHLRSSLYLEPERAQTLIALAELRLTQDRPGDACAVLNAALEAEPNAIDAYILRAIARIPLHEYRAAWADAETAMRLGSPTQAEAVSVLVDLAANDSAAGRNRARRLAQMSMVRSNRALSVREGQLLAYAFTAVGDYATAMRSLQRVMPRGAALWRVMQDARLTPLRRTAAFRALLAAAAPMEVQS